MIQEIVDAKDVPELMKAFENRLKKMTIKTRMNTIENHRKSLKTNENT